jgi:hypothetical protein
MPALSTQFQFVINSGTFTATSVSIPSAALAADGTPNFKSLPQKGDGYFGASDGLHTVTYTVTPNFAGSLAMEATLATAPAEADWFTVANSTVTYTFPIVPATTTTNYINFTGNFVWVRAHVIRTADQPNGTVQFINYNH